MTETSPQPEKHWFRVHFHDETTQDHFTVNSLVAEKNARAKNPGGFVKKIKRLKEVKSDAR
ncbi:hypothetical protein [Rhizobium sp. Leaf386]|uniref:hypothetical protein n=1 Tax=Rhizobium sp. Leaf386 TaxID=1736359 RepID=UPI000712A4DA|nr:hypothetical protein [Rhizobium sp. Leaf386]KQS90328.1 hypothetical protein ASG50_07690 [Rhizobium sp. Leaf386]